MEVFVAGGRVGAVRELDSSTEVDVAGGRVGAVRELDSSTEVNVAGGRVGLAIVLLSNVDGIKVVVSELVGSSVASVKTEVDDEVAVIGLFSSVVTVLEAEALEVAFKNPDVS